MQVQSELVKDVLNDLKIEYDVEEDVGELIENIEDQLAKFERQRLEAQEEDAPDVQLKHFVGVGHLLWWVLSSPDFDINDPVPNHTPNHEGFDDFLCLWSQSRELKSIRTLLDVVESELTEFGIFSDDHQELIENIRENVADVMENVIGDKDLAVSVERGCYLYSCMLACVDCNRDDKMYQRWSQCYATKLSEMLNSVCVMNIQTLDIDQAMMVPFIKREELFKSTRAQLLAKVVERINADKKIYDAENDRSNIESDFQCPKCQSYKTKQYPLQMRSADEPMSILWRCFACNKSGIEK